LITYFKLSTKKYRLYNYLILLNHKDSIVTFFYRTISYSIYHNIRCVHRLRGSQGVSDGKPVKQGNKPPENQPETRRLCFYGMHEYARKCIAQNFTPCSQWKSCFRRSSHPKTVNGDAIYCVTVKRWQEHQA
ncbi:hypothetical protein, partial [Salmonella enterica]|uniref:hypothetical protein n=6 Tax=Pseudomonadota TaxID=1224 RepID=UPI001BAEA9F7